MLRTLLAGTTAAFLVFAACDGSEPPSGDNDAGTSDASEPDASTPPGVSATLAVVWTEKPSAGAEEPVSGGVLIDRGGVAVTNAVVKLNGTTLGYDIGNSRYEVPSSLSGVGPGKSLHFEVDTGDLTGSVDVKCLDVAITSPSESAAFAGNETMNVSWSGSLENDNIDPAKLRVDYYKNGVVGGVNGVEKKLDKKSTSTTITTPLSQKGSGFDYILGLYAPGPLATIQLPNNGLIGGSCKVWRRVGLTAKP